jgi:beta-lactamase class A
MDGMKRLPVGLLVVLLLWLLSALACGDSDGAVQPTVSISPNSEPTVTPTERPRPTPSAVPATAAVVPTGLPTVSPPEVESLEDLSADVAVPELPATFAPPSEDPALDALIRTTLSGYEGSYSVVVRNLEDGRSASLNEGQVYGAASLFKLALLLEAYRQRDAGEIDFSQVLTLDEEYAGYDLGTLEYLELEVGDTLTLADALRAMIIVSDTPTAVMVQDVVNPWRVDQTLRSLGLKDMSVMSNDLPTTAQDMALLMEAVAAGEGVTAESRSEMLALLLQEWVWDGIPSGVPANSAVAHKTGNLTDVTHDVALVWGPAGPYIIAVLSDRSWDWEAMVAASRAVWDYFAADP